MRILIKQFLSKNHSWSVCGWGWAQGLIDIGHTVELFSTDGNCKQHLPKELLPNLIGYIEENGKQVFGRIPDNNYDMCLSYTCMKNFPWQLNHGTNRFGTWCYEWQGKGILPIGFAKHHKSCDKLISPSNFAKLGFMDSGIPENYIAVIPHGINSDKFRKSSTILFKTKKQCKILVNVAQLHRRKNLLGLLEAYGKAFTNKDDVCLILKAKDKIVVSPFEVSLKDCLSKFYSKFPQHAEIEIYPNFIDDISELYRSVDIVYSLSNAEAFHFPSLEAISAGKMVIASNWGGQLDFLDNSNSLLVVGKEAQADQKSMYWSSNPNAIWFIPNINDAVDKLRYAYQHYNSINGKVKEQQESVLQEYDWKNIASKFLALCK